MNPRRRTPKSFLILIGWLSLLSLLRAEIPPLRGYVNDYAGILSPAEEAALTEKLRRFEQQTSNQIVILTVPSLEGQDIESYSIQVAEAWQVGQADKDNGVILLVAPKERKYRIEVGYGLEPVLPDGLVGAIGRRYLVPAFRRGEYGAGLSAAVDALIAASQGEFQAEEGSATARARAAVRERQLWLRVLLLVGLFVGIVLVFSGGRRRRNREVLGRRWRGGGPWFGGFGGFGGGGFGGGGGFSGGGGSFGGGGASGSW